MKFKTDSSIAINNYSNRVLITHDDTIPGAFIRDRDLFTDKWDTVAQPKFWKVVMALTPDSAVLNIAATREIIDVVALSFWSPKSDSWKDAYKDSVRKAHGLASDARIYMTSGKSHFYRIDKTLANINGALPVFDSMNTDPWYAQTILLIESPNSMNSSSSVGAHGPFQLMKSVATKRGLIVNSRIDEREDLTKSATAAAKLIKYICIPETRRMLDRQGIKYREDDLWFRLMVMHSYHAGAGNVRGVIEKINPKEGGMQLIREMWQTEYKGFRNASQNYSQVALAAHIRLDEYLSAQDTFFILEGDRLFDDYKRHPRTDKAGLATMDSIINLYELDLLENRTPFTSFLNRVRLAEKEKQAIIDARQNPSDDIAFKRYPSSLKHLNRIGYKLLRRNRHKDAIAAFKLNVEAHPESWNVYDSLGEAYMKSGNKKLAIENYEKSVKLNPKNYGGKKALEKLRG